MDFGDNDPAAEFLAREQDQLADIGDEIIAPDPSAVTSMMGTGGLEDDLSTGGQQTDLTDLTGESPQDLLSEPAVQSEPFVQKVEAEKIVQWRQEQRKRLEEKDSAEQLMMEEWRETAKKELQDWYKQYEQSVEATRATNREAEKELKSHGNKSTRDHIDWEQIANMCEFNQNPSRSTRDTSRMRGLLLQLKQNPPQLHA